MEQKESIHNLGRQLDVPPPIEAWMSWIDPKTEEPDFHVPTLHEALREFDQTRFDDIVDAARTAVGP